MDSNRLFTVLKRASWFTALAVGSIILIVLATEEGWDYPEDYLPTTLITTLVTFILFRVAIWVIKGFFPERREKEASGTGDFGGNHPLTKQELQDYYTLMEQEEKETGKAYACFYCGARKRKEGPCPKCGKITA